MDAHGQGHVVGAAGLVDTVDEPESVLGVGQASGRALRKSDDRGSGPGGRVGDPSGQGRGGGRLEQVAHPHVRAEQRTHAGDHPSGQEGVPAEGEEVLVGADPVAAEHLGEDPAEDLLGGAGRGASVFEGVAGGGGVGQGLAVDLAVGGEREGGQGDDRAGDHVIG